MVQVIEIYNLQDIGQMEAARYIFDQTWPTNIGTEITPNLLQVMVHCGAYLSGAFIKEKCVGAAFAFPATNNGLHLHSHMTAVLDGHRDQGVGYALKVDQWNWAKKHKYSHLSWTFDPLVRRNTKFNIVKLGVDISAYYPNFYGEMSDALNTGDESDRLMVSWRTDTNAPEARELITHPKLHDILIGIPKDIVEIRKRDIAENLIWRRQVREQFMQAFAAGGRVVGFSVNNEYVVRI